MSEHDDNPPEPKKPYHGFKSSEPRDKRGRWITRVVPIVVPPPLVPLIPAILLRQDPAPAPRTMTPEDNATQADVNAEIPGALTGLGCGLALLVAVAGIVALLFYAASTVPLAGPRP